MSPLTAAAVAAAIQVIGEIMDQLSKGKITDEQAQAYLKASADHYAASVAAWNASFIILLLHQHPPPPQL